MSKGAFPESPLEFGIFDWIEWSELPAGEIFEHKLQIAEAADKVGACRPCRWSPPALRR